MILPTKVDINKAKAAERKIEIDNGVALARQIDSLRSTFAQEKILHEQWKKTSTTELNRTLEGLQDGIDAKKRELIDLEEQRKKLIEPLDLEWLIVREKEEQLVRKSRELFLDQERHKQKVKDLDEKREKVQSSLKKSKQNEKETEKVLIDAQEFERLAQKKYQEASIFKEQTENSYTERGKEITEQAKVYEVALQTIEIREKQVQDKEVELSEREVLLKDRMAMHERNLNRQQ